MLETLKKISSSAWDYAEEKVPESLRNLGTAGQVSSVVKEVIVGTVTVIIGISILAYILALMAELPGGSAVDNVIEAVRNMSYGVFNLLSVISIVLVAGIIIAIIVRLGGR